MRRRRWSNDCEGASAPALEPPAKAGAEKNRFALQQKTVPAAPVAISVARCRARENPLFMWHAPEKKATQLGRRGTQPGCSDGTVQVFNKSKSGSSRNGEKYCHW